MKSVLFFSAFLSTIALAEKSCLITRDSANRVISLCSKLDYENSYDFACYLKRPVCFTGNAKVVVDKINSSIFQTGDASIVSGLVINSNEISFGYGDVGGACYLRTASRCQ
ncbi:MAG: hypothetical protein ACXWR0_04945 [Bdellovibrio sp.]